jgi:hypothetical protein
MTDQPKAAPMAPANESTAKVAEDVATAKPAVNESEQTKPAPVEIKKI